MHFRHFIIILISFSFVVPVFSQNKITTSLTGKWVGTDTKKETGSLEFLDSVNIILTIPGQTLPRGVYRIDSSKTPMRFYITIKGPAGALTLKGFLTIIDRNTIKWQPFFDGKIPTAPIKESDDNTILLKRAKTIRD